MISVEYLKKAQEWATEEGTRRAIKYEICKVCNKHRESLWVYDYNAMDGRLLEEGDSFPTTEELQNL